jgi:hypothetical protein
MNKIPTGTHSAKHRGRAVGDWPIERDLAAVTAERDTYKKPHKSWIAIDLGREARADRRGEGRCKVSGPPLKFDKPTPNRAIEKVIAWLGIGYETTVTRRSDKKKITIRITETIDAAKQAETTPNLQAQHQVND